VIELYAIAAHPGPPIPPLSSPASLRAVPVGALAAICAPAVEREVTPEALWRHEEVVEALMEDRDLLPVRYGTLVEDDAAAVRAVAARRSELAAALDRVRGAVELAVRAVATDPEDGDGEHRDGADYLRTKHRVTAAQDEVARVLHEPLSALARADVRGVPRPPSELLRAAYLVDRDAVATFTRLIGRLDERNRDLQLLCTGPWPPYSFAQA
jgi:gas vesicle protein GvpL/GvpF